VIPILAQIHSVITKYAKIHNFSLLPLQGTCSTSPSTHIDQIPSFFVDNNPVVSPLAILGLQDCFCTWLSYQIHVVQWHGLSPDDAMWETWDELLAAYNLEDTVVVDGGNNGMTENEAA